MSMQVDCELTGELKYCNCARCHLELLGASCRRWWHLQPSRVRLDNPIVMGRINGRPYCNGCLSDHYGTGQQIEDE